MSGSALFDLLDMTTVRATGDHNADGRPRTTVRYDSESAVRSRPSPDPEASTARRTAVAATASARTAQRQRRSTAPEVARKPELAAARRSGALT